MTGHKIWCKLKIYWKQAIAISMLLIFQVIEVPGSHAAGLLIADGGFGGVLEIKEHDVKVMINNGIAVTKVTQVFQNTENRQVEALYTFPVPKGASVANFSMWINGKEMVGEVLEKERARRIYNSYKRKRKDPGLLEQKDYKTFEMRIFPINAGAEQKVEITYYQELNVEHNQAGFVYPLATVTREDIDADVTGKFAFNMEVKSAIPIASIQSPSHPNDFVVAHHTENYWLASLESKGGSLAGDIVVNYDLKRPKTGIDLLTSRTSGEDGYFCLTITSGEELAKLDRGLDYVFVLDISGSMSNAGKLLVSKKAVNSFVEALDEEDRFEIMTFNITPNTLFNQLHPANNDWKQQAAQFLATQQARGGTVLAPAMNTAYRYSDPDRRLNVVILSDGMTEQKEIRELIRLIGSRPSNCRVFCIGIGNEVNKPLLEQLADDSGGLAAFISREDDFKRQAGAFKRKLMRPVATDLNLDLSAIRATEIVPDNLPNLYHGAPVRIYGRYRGEGSHLVTLKANVRGKEIKQTAELTFPATDDRNPEIERMWAWKKIDQLNKKAKREGDSLTVRDEIIFLGETYSIVTEYTSFLVLENDAEYKRWKIERRNRDRIGRDRKAQNDRQKALERLRQTAFNALGTEPLLAKNTTGKRVKPVQTRNTLPKHAPSNISQPQRRQSFDIDVGTGPVGPLFVGGAYWLRRRRKKKLQKKS